jgi:hypothetical protein
MRAVAFFKVVFQNEDNRLLIENRTRNRVITRQECQPLTVNFGFHISDIVLFICSLFKDFFSNSDYVASNEGIVE